MSDVSATSPLAVWREKLAGVTPGEWQLQDGSSWRRIGTPGHDGNVLCPSVYSERDRHPDLVAGRGEDIYANLRHIISAHRLSRILADEATVEGLARMLAPAIRSTPTQCSRATRCGCSTKTRFGTASTTLLNSL